PSITSKFYSEYEGTRLRNIKSKYVDEIMNSYRKRPQDHYIVPLLESQKCGWHAFPLMEIDRYDKRLFFGKRTSDMVKMQFLS
ncbi:uncharacterized protein GBIM_18604, partial [Gryllus bimaculatus]